MPAPKRNQFAKGNKGGGRKGYEYEEKQLKAMKEILNKGLKLTKKILKGKAVKEEISAYNISMKVLLKVMDKLHANRQHIEGEIKTEKELPKELTPEEQDLLKKAIELDYGEDYAEKRVGERANTNEKDKENG